MSSKSTVAFLGAGGAMGLGMAANIARAGLPLRAWNRSREKAEPLAEDGASVLDTPEQAAGGADILITMLSDSAAVLEVMDGEHGFLAGMHGPLIWVQMRRPARLPRSDRRRSARSALPAAQGQGDPRS
jgi:3-hydroxyisobutyrate dehydrogenase